MGLLGDIAKMGLVVGKTAVAIKVPVALPIFAAIENLVNKAEKNHPEPKQGTKKHTEVMGAAPAALEEVGIDPMDIDANELETLIKLLVLVKKGQLEIAETVGEKV